MAVNDALSVPCPQCGTSVAVEPQQVGRPASCPFCRASVPIPAAISEGDAQQPTETSYAGYEFDLDCPLCGTRQTLTNAQVGGKVACVDCFTELDVSTPPPSRRRTIDQSTPATDELTLSAPAENKPFESIANDLLLAAETELHGALPPRDPLASTRQTLRDAEAEEAARDKPPDLPERPFDTGILRFLRYASAWLPLIALTGALHIEVQAIESSIVLAENENPITQVASLGLRVFGGVFGIATLATMAACVIGVTQDTAHRLEEIENWPSVGFIEWIGDTLFVFIALFVSTLAPAFALATLADLIGAPILYWPIAMVVGFLGLVLVFPYLFLSMLESSSLLGFGSKELNRSLLVGRPYWRSFVARSAPLIACSGGLILIRALWSASPWLVDLAIAFALVLSVMVYSRWLGRLAWCCDEAIVAAEEVVERPLGGSAEGTS